MGEGGESRRSRQPGNEKCADKICGVSGENSLTHTRGVDVTAIITKQAAPTGEGVSCLDTEDEAWYTRDEGESRWGGP
jgi:hypothetical protein